MIWLSLYLWVCSIFIALTGISTVRPVNMFDIICAIVFPIIFPPLVIMEIYARLRDR